MADPPLSDIDLKNKTAWVSTTLKTHENVLTFGKSSGSAALFSNGKTTEIPSNEKIAVPKKRANFSKF